MYSIDASALIDGWRRYYPPDVLPTLWTRLDELVRQDRLVAIEDVKFELARGGDDLFEWVSDRAQMFRVPVDGIQERVRQIVDRFPAFLPERTPDGIWADPYVIALAQAENLIVVTGEKRAADNARQPNIPNVCEALGVECISLLDLIRREGWRF